MTVTSTYPGHPVRVAIQIMENFPDHETANANGKEGWAEALSCSAVRGAGGAVLQGLGITEMLSTGSSPEEAYDYGCMLWRRSRESGDFIQNLNAGEAEALALRDQFITTAENWTKRPDSTVAAA